MDAGLSRELIALRVARELREGMVVNLGIGLPTLVSNFLPPDKQLLFQAENGILGYGVVSDEEFDPDLINAGGQPVALVKAARADRLGNLVYRMAGRNFNPVMATAADLVIAEVEQVVDAGELDPESIGTPGVYVDRVVQCEPIPIRWFA